jgi:hypothetical protein
MRRNKPSSQSSGGYNNQHRKPRYQGSGGGGGGHHQHGGHNRPRKNYAATREKYLAQARDALASGDRVMAEYFYQHADHCYRMMAEEGFRPRPENTAQAGGEAPQDQGQPEDGIPQNSSQLPAFITASYEGGGQANPAEQPAPQNWEERDA